MRISLLDVTHHSFNIADTSNLMKLFKISVYSPHVKVKASTILHTSYTKPAVEVLVGPVFL